MTKFIEKPRTWGEWNGITYLVSNPALDQVKVRVDANVQDLFRNSRQHFVDTRTLIREGARETVR